MEMLAYKLLGKELKTKIKITGKIINQMIFLNINGRKELSFLPFMFYPVILSSTNNKSFL